MLDVHLIFFHLSLPRWGQLAVTRRIRPVRYLLLVTLRLALAREEDVALGVTLVRQVHRLFPTLDVEHLGGGKVSLGVDEFGVRDTHVPMHLVTLDYPLS